MTYITEALSSLKFKIWNSILAKPVKIYPLTKKCPCSDDAQPNPRTLGGRWWCDRDISSDYITNQGFACLNGEGMDKNIP